MRPRWPNMVSLPFSPYACHSLPLSTFSFHTLPILTFPFQVKPEQLQLDAVPEWLRATSLAGVLPTPPAVAVRCYQPNEYSHLWLTQVQS